MRTLVISDIHGCLNEFLKLLKIINYIPNQDRLILLGDYVDRGPNSKEVIQEIMRLAQNDNIIVVRGNHDQRFLSLIKDNKFELLNTFLEYGGKETLDSYCPDTEKQSYESIFNYINTNYHDHFEFLSKTKLYYEDEQFIYVHAGLNPKYSFWKNQPENDFLTMRTDFISNKTNVDKRVIFGHTVTKSIHNSASIWFADDKIGIDGGCALGYQLNCLEIKGEKEFREYHVKFGDI